MALPTRVVRHDPFQAIQREFDTALNRFFGAQSDIEGAWATYAVDVREDADHLYVEAELPGFKKDDIDITLENRVLTISAERKEEKSEGDEKQGEYLLRERRYARFLRSFTLPTTVDEQKVQARLTDGVLHITLDKRPETKPRKVQVA